MNKIKKLAFIRSSYRPDGGAEKILQRIITVLQKEYSYDIYMLTRKWQASNTPAENKLKILNCKSGGISRRSRFTGFIKAVQQIINKENFDIVQSHERIPGCQIYRAGDGVHQKWIDIRKEDSHFLQKLALSISPFHRQVINTEKELFYHKNLHYIICNSKQVQNEILEYYPNTDPSKLILIRNGINLHKFAYADKTAKEKARQSLGFFNNDYIIAFVGSGFYRKGLKLLLEALHIRKKWKLLVIGNDKKIKSYKNVCKKLGIDDRVIFYGKQNKVIQYYQAADLIVHPALYDPAPNVVLEAMAVGRPVICSSNCGTSELITSGKNGFVCNHKDANKLAEQLKKCEHHSLLDKMGKDARLVAESFSIEKMIYQMIEIYNNINNKHLQKS